MQTYEKKLEKRNLIAMLGFNGTFMLLWVFVSIFLVAQVFFVTNYDLAAVALFVLIEVIAIFIFYWIASWASKKIKAIWMVRAATVLICVFLVLVIVWQDGLQSHYMVFGLMWGAVQGLYWGATNFLISKVFNKEKVMTFFIICFVMNSVVTIVFPFTFGFAIDFGSWALTSGAVLGVGILQLVFTFILKTGMQEDRQLQIKEYFRTLKKSGKLKSAFGLWFVVFFAGFPYTLTAMMTILIIMAYGTNVSIGIIGSIFAVFGIVALLLYRMSKDKIKSPMFWVSSILPLVASIGLFFYVGPLTVIIFNAALVLPQNIVNVEENNARINAFRHIGGEQFMIESHLFYESAFLFGRVLSCCLLLIVAATGTTQTALAIGMAIILLVYVIHAATLFIWRRSNVQLINQETQK
ncbi:MAG: hypothetical protein FWE45_00730 [Firmicutes bacterium]|nr:hypothetical protein [Bacillota bacterium]